VLTHRSRSTANNWTDMRSSILLLFAVLPGLAISGENVCNIGDECSIAGVITIYRTPPAFTAVLEKEPTCIPLALPDSIYSDFESWNGKQVTILGEALPNYGSDDGVGAYEVNGRNVTAAICNISPYIIFVSEISVAE